MPDDRAQITDDFAKLCDIVAKLRAPDGCPWDREQTNESLLPALIEEAYEAAEAARAQDDTHFREELGDLLLLVVMHAQIAHEAGRFDIEEVIEHVSDKLIRRHPHVFGTSEARDSGAVLKQWEAIKREEKNANSHFLASLPKALPAVRNGNSPRKNTRQSQERTPRWRQQGRRLAENRGARRIGRTLRRRNGREAENCIVPASL
jgi:MazG family protein